MVAPVIEEGATSRRVYLPTGVAWTHLWSGTDYGDGWAEVPAPVGLPPVFFRPESSFAGLFRSIAEMHRKWGSSHG
jgi:alpha-glucosidase